MGFSGSQHEDNMWWWFLKRFEQGIRGAITKHVDFIYDVDLVAGLVGGIVDLLTEAPNIINASVAGGINFYDIQSSGLGYCLAHGASIARLSITTGKTVHCLSQNAGGAGLTSSPWATKKIGVRYMATNKGVVQCLCYRFLPDYLS